MTIFEEAKGVFSMRRVLAIFFAILSSVAGLYAIFNKLEWQAIAASFSIPAIVCLVLMFFTTWQDVTELIRSTKRLD